MAEKIEIVIDDVPKYESIAPAVARMVEVFRKADKPVLINAIAKALKTDWTAVRNAMRFLETGERQPAKPDRRRRTRGQEALPKKRDRDSDKVEVVRLREEENWSFERIGKKFEIAPATAASWYDELRPEAVHQAVVSGEKSFRGRWRHIPPQKISEIRRLIGEGRLNPAEIANAVGVSQSTVRRVRKEVHSR